MITRTNYLQKRPTLINDMKHWEQSMKDADKFFMEYHDLYGEDKTIDKTIDLFIDKLNSEGESPVMVKKNETKEPVLDFEDLPYNHPLNILDKKSSQYKEALKEYNEGKAEKPKGVKDEFSKPIEVPINKIFTREGDFQNRATKFSQATVDKIVAEGYDKRKSPIKVWKDEKDGKYYIISGHSRFQAATELHDAGDKNLDTLFVQEYLGSYEDAKDYATIKSNRESNKEGLLGDIRAYVRASKRGYNKKELLKWFNPDTYLAELKRLAFLNPKGKFLQYIDSVEGNSFPYLRRNANWVGQLKDNYPSLSDAHETEMFNYFYTQGTDALKLKHDAFFNLIEKKVGSAFFKPDEPLNLKSQANVSGALSMGVEYIKEVQSDIDKRTERISKLQGLVARARKENAEPKKIKEFQDEITAQSNTIIELIEKQNKAKHNLAKLDRETMFDLFTQDEELEELHTPEEEIKETADSCPPVDANGVARIDKEGLQKLQVCIDNETPTDELYSKDGVYTPEREKLHEQIVQKFKENKPCVTHKKPVAILTGGPPGSGKSYFLKNYAKWITGNTLYHIDADEVRAKLPEYKGWNADNTHTETSHIVREMLKSIGEPCEHDLIWDGTMNSAKNYLPLIDLLKDLGYQVFVIYLQVPKEVSLQRAMERYQRTGRYVPERVIDDVFSKGLDAYEKVIKFADGYIRVDGLTGKIVEEGGKQIPPDRSYTNEVCENCETPVQVDDDIIEVTFSPTYYDEKNNKRKAIQYDVNYLVTFPNKDFIELTGKLKPIHTGRDYDYEFEVDYFADKEEEDYYDENSEKIEEQILEKFYNRFTVKKNDIVIHDKMGTLYKVKELKDGYFIIENEKETLSIPYNFEELKVYRKATGEESKDFKAAKRPKKQASTGGDLVKQFEEENKIYNTPEENTGIENDCKVVSEKFIAFAKSKGNDEYKLISGNVKDNGGDNYKHFAVLHKPTNTVIDFTNGQFEKGKQTKTYPVQEFNERFTIKQAATVKKAVAEKKDEYNKAEAEKSMKELMSKASESSDHWDQSKVLHLAQQFEKLRTERGQARDEKGDSKKRLTPTRENLIRWMNNPGGFDLIGIDTFKKDDANSDLKIKKEVFWNRFGIKYNHE